MAQTIPETKVESNFQLTGSVGRGGKNIEDDVERIKRMLNKISSENGGANDTLDETDLSRQGPDFEAMVFQIRLFQDINFPQWINGRINPSGFAPDGLVEPGRASWRRMRALMRSRQGGLQTSTLSVRPDTPITGQCNGFGFSAALLKKTFGQEEWDQRNLFGTATQCIPKDGKRVIVVSTTPANDPFTAAIADETKAVILNKEGPRITIKGIAAGQTTLWIHSESGIRTMLNLVIRPALKLKIDMLHIGSPTGFAMAVGKVEAMAFAISKIFINQANIEFELGVREAVKEITSGLVTFPMTGRPMVINGIGPSSFLVDMVPYSDLKKLVRNTDAITLFTHENITDGLSPTALGASQLRSKHAWMNINSPYFLTQTAAHEIGHSLGLQHITATGNQSFLMNPVTQEHNIIIPSDTLGDLMI
jgi:hypothetical protein